MKCFNHADKDAVALCKSCSRALCTECYVDVGNGIACKGACEEKTRDLNALVEHNVAAAKKYGVGEKPLLSKIAAGFVTAGGILLILSLLFGKIYAVEKYVGFAILAGLASLLIAAVLFVVNHFFVSLKSKREKAIE